MVSQAKPNSNSTLKELRAYINKHKLQLNGKRITTAGKGRNTKAVFKDVKKAMQMEELTSDSSIETLRDYIKEHNYNIKTAGWGRTKEKILLDIQKLELSKLDSSMPIMKSLRDYIKRYRLPIKTSGLGRTKVNILSDMRRAILSEEDANRDPPVYPCDPETDTKARHVDTTPDVEESSEESCVDTDTEMNKEDQDQDVSLPSHGSNDHDAGDCLDEEGEDDEKAEEFRVWKHNDKWLIPQSRILIIGSRGLRNKHWYSKGKVKRAFTKIKNVISAQLIVESRFEIKVMVDGQHKVRKYRSRDGKAEQIVRKIDRMINLHQSKAPKPFTVGGFLQQAATQAAEALTSDEPVTAESLVSGLLKQAAGQAAGALKKQKASESFMGGFLRQAASQMAEVLAEN